MRSFLLFGQTPGAISVEGNIIDSVSRIALPNVTIDIEQIPAGSREKMTTDNNGNFSFKGIKGAKYNLSISLMSYDSKSKQILVPETHSSDKYTIDTIVLDLKTIALDAANVTGIKQLVKQEIDRISYSVKDDPDNKFETTLDMMKKVPLLSVDGLNNVEFKGRRDFKIMLNGKISSLFTSDPGTALRSIPANTIDRIEVITNPPSKYDAEGITGLINIVTKKNTIDGYNGNVATAYNFPYGPIGSATLTYKSGKFGMDLFGYYFGQRQPATVYGNSAHYNVSNENLTQSGNQKYNGGALNTNGQFNYEIDSLNLLILSVNRKINSFDQYVDLESNLVDAQSQVLQSYALSQNGEPKWNSTDVDFNYEKRFKRNKDQLMTFSYKFSKSDNIISDAVRYSFRNNFAGNDFDQYNYFGLKEHSIQTDYTHPFKNLTLEVGGKISFRDNKSNFNRNFLTGSSPDDIANEFSYEHTIYNLYNSYQYTSGKWAFKGGARLDATRLPKVAENENGEFFWKILPSVSVQRSIKNGSFNLGYNQRIQRPNILELNPFIDTSNPLVVSSGNPYLRPVIGHNFELSYSIFGKGSTYISLGYIHIGNNIEKVVMPLADTIINNTYANIGKNDDINLNVNINQPISKKIRLNFNGMLSYVNLTGTFGEEHFENDGLRTSLRLNSTYQINDDLRTGVTLNYTSPIFYLQGKSNAFPTISANISRQFFKKKLSIFASINNPFSKYFDIRRDNTTAQFVQNSFTQYYYRTFVVTLNYSFGKLKESLAKAKKTINSEDIKPVEINLSK